MVVDETAEPAGALEEPRRVRRVPEEALRAAAKWKSLRDEVRGTKPTTGDEVDVFATHVMLRLRALPNPERDLLLFQLAVERLCGVGDDGVVDVRGDLVYERVLAR